MQEPSHDNLLGELLNGKYRVLRLIGAGGMGAVYEGVQEQLKKGVALKVLSPELVTSEGKLRRFQREAEVVASISHPNVAHVFDFFVHNELPVIAMELIRGSPLSQVLSTEGRLRPSRVISITSQILSALEATHNAHIVHRDLKPNNVMLTSVGTNEWVKLVDFGIALMTEETGATRLTRAGEVLGTPTYMSPEQLMGDDVDGRADIYSLGAIMYKALSGLPPYQVASFEDLLKAMMEHPPPAVSALEPFAPENLSRVVIKALSRSPDRRFAGPREMAAALEEALSGGHVSVASKTRSDKPRHDITGRDRDSPPPTDTLWVRGKPAADATERTVDLRGLRSPSQPREELRLGGGASSERTSPRLSTERVAPTMATAPLESSRKPAHDIPHERPSSRRTSRRRLALIAVSIVAVIGVVCAGAIVGVNLFRMYAPSAHDRHTQAGLPSTVSNDHISERASSDALETDCGGCGESQRCNSLTGQCECLPAKTQYVSSTGILHCCGGDNPVFCEQGGHGACFRENTDCSTAQMCHGTLCACPRGGASHCIEGGFRCCGGDLPQFCQVPGFPGGCFRHGTDCSTLTPCGGAWYGCGPGFIVRCTTGGSGGCCSVEMPILCPTTEICVARGTDCSRVPVSR